MKKAINSIIFFIALLGSTSPLQAQREWLIHKVDSVFESQIQNLKIPGGIVQIKKEGNIIYTKAYGVAQKYNDYHELIENPEK